MGSSNTDAVHIGILGAAEIARKQCRSFAKYLSQPPYSNTVRLVAIASRDIDKAQRMIDEWGLNDRVKAYGAYQDLLDDANIHAVYIPLPTSLHVEWVGKAAAAGKHILLEKPVAVTAEDTDTILSLCDKFGVFLMDGTMWMHHARTKDVEQRIFARHEAMLGKIVEVVSTFSFFAPEAFRAVDIRFKRDGDPLGCLGDVGWYCIRAILWAYRFEAPIAVQAHAGPEFNEQGVPVSIGGTVLFENNRRGTFTCSFDRALWDRFEIGGTDGTLVVENFVIPSKELEEKYYYYHDHGLIEAHSQDVTRCDTIVVKSEIPQEAAMWLEFARCVKSVRAGEGVDRSWAAVAALTQKTLCAVMHSAQNRCCVVDL